jgi:hypothetical protein
MSLLWQDVASISSHFDPWWSRKISQVFHFCFPRYQGQSFFQYQFLLWSIDLILFLIQLPCESLWIASPAITARPLPCQPRPSRRPGSPSQLLWKVGIQLTLLQYIIQKIYIYDGWYIICISLLYGDILSRLYGIIYIYNFYNSWFVKRVNYGLTIGFIVNRLYKATYNFGSSAL